MYFHWLLVKSSKAALLPILPDKKPASPIVLAADKSEVYYMLSSFFSVREAVPCTLRYIL